MQMCRSEINFKSPYNTNEMAGTEVPAVLEPINTAYVQTDRSSSLRFSYFVADRACRGARCGTQELLLVQVLFRAG